MAVCWSLIWLDAEPIYILDSNVISELRQGKTKPKSTAQRQAKELCLSAITVLDLDMGARRMERKDSSQGKVVHDWVERILV